MNTPASQPVAQPIARRADLPPAGSPPEVESYYEAHRKVYPREPTLPLAGYDHWAPPEVGHQERVYLHEELVSEAGWATAKVFNPQFPLGAGLPTCPLTLALSWATDTLPTHVEWRMAGAGEHVLGIEPTNCNVRGRAASRADGSLVMIEPGEAKTFAMALECTISSLRKPLLNLLMFIISLLYNILVVY